MIRLRPYEWLVSASLLGAIGGCAVTGVGVGYGGEADYVGGYYEPYGYEYGGWGPGYRVGPRWGGGHRDADHHDGDRHDGDRHDGGHQDGDHHGRGPAPGRPYRPAPPARSVPSIPGHPRGH